MAACLAAEWAGWICEVGQTRAARVQSQTSRLFERCEVSRYVLNIRIRQMNCHGAHDWILTRAIPKRAQLRRKVLALLTGEIRVQGNDANTILAVTRTAAPIREPFAGLLIGSSSHARPCHKNRYTQ